ncbi:MAG: sulfate adenylyltransferase subunit CysN [Silvibacterium sp.]|nr:sulfate adenylyltransferase subunit CysN [Silvibacterium sp.]MBV8437585.1 sulfate adenylyltransferase subunit CysN [Silvibacterium sp.]
MAAATLPGFSIHEFLREEREKDLLRFSTAGSVDDGKSTLIGRLLYDTQSVYEDQVRSIEGKGTTAPGQLDFALLTDGLRAEREQGITIDVAYRYFSTARRKFIIADTPGHEQYTRNMATGASTADAAVVLIDATKGVLVQSRRHAYIASLLRVRHVLVAVNKMDLVGFDEAAFRTSERDFAAVLDRIAEDTGTPVETTFVPVSALIGDNIVHRSRAMPWYGGPTLLQLLESVPASDEARFAPLRFPVQRVLRPDHTFRGFAGQIASGAVRHGDTVTIASSGRTATVNRIVTWNGDLAEAHAPLSVTLVLDQELDISRGDLIVAHDELPVLSKSIKASMVWMDQHPLDLRRRYLLKHTTRTVPAFVTSIDHRANIHTLSHEPAKTLEMNSIGVLNLSLLQPIAVDLYRANRSTGSFILIDPITNSTVAAGMITAASDRTQAATDRRSPVTAPERVARFGHRGGVLELIGPHTIIDQIERSLFDQGAITVRINHEAPSLTQPIVDAGLIALVVSATETNTLKALVETHEITVDSDDLHDAVSAVHRLLTKSGIFVSGKADHP